MKWTKEREDFVLRKRQEKLSYREIAEMMGSTTSSIKHKVRRLQQNLNMDRYKHTTEKQNQLRSLLPLQKYRILETHCGFGGMTEFYQDYGDVLSWDIKQNRVAHIKKHFPSVKCERVDSEHAIHGLIYEKRKFNLIDIDPYGFPSRFFPHVFKLMGDGLLVVTIPVMGVAQINKIMIRHYQSFWDIQLEDKKNYIEKIIKKLTEYGFMNGKELTIENVMKLDRVYRLAISVKHVGLTELSGIKIDTKENKNA